MNSKLGRSIVLWLMLALGLVTAYHYFNKQGKGSEQIKDVKTSVLFDEIQKDNVQSVNFKGNEVLASLKQGGKIKTILADPSVEAVLDKLTATGKIIEFDYKMQESRMSFLSILIWLFPTLLIIGFWFFMMRQASGGGKGGMGNPFSFGKSKAKLISENQNKVTFKDVAGIEEAKKDVEEIVEFLKSPAKFQKLGGRIPKGVLLVGPPGTGKTLLARAIAGEAGVPFFSIAGSDFVEMFVGVGASRVRDMFEQAKKNAPCIIFVDEIDAIGRSRSQGITGGHEEREQTLNQLLVEMDGFEANEGIIILAATNRVDVLDKALLRPGRFDRHVTVPNPDLKGREEILLVHSRKVPLASDVNLATVARGTTGFSGADLANLVNEAALRAARLDKKLVTADDFEFARDRVRMGSERRGLLMKLEDKERTAYHEAGHALVSFYVPVKSPLHKLTIIPRGPALGFAEYLPEDDGVSYSREQMEAELAMTFGGRAAEELVYGKEKITSGASGDIRMATHLARRMVEEWGYSDRLGRLYYGKEEQGYFGATRDIAPDTAKIIDEEIKTLIDRAEERAKKILAEKRHELDLLTQGMLEYETLTAEQARKVIAGEKLVFDAPVAAILPDNEPSPSIFGKAEDQPKV